jgi:hypothetical protein
MGRGIRYTWPVAIVFAGNLILTSAHPHDPSHQHTDWFLKQRNKSGDVCCDGSDAHYLGPDEWTRTKGNYRVRIRGVWFDIEDSKMLRPDGEPNPTGQAILWYQLTEFGFSIRCFTPQYES